MARPQLNTVTIDYVLGAELQIMDIPYGLSLLNRKSYRSGYVYSVDFIEYIPHESSTASHYITAMKIPENYNTLGAYKLGYDHWCKQRAEAIAETGIQPGKWSDFKPWYNVDHYTAALPEITPSGINAALSGMAALDLTSSEWNRADIEVNDNAAATTTRLGVGMLGDDDLAVSYGSLLEAWGDTRGATVAPDPLTPGVASLSWITSTGPASDEMTGEVIQLIEFENDYPPYANEEDPTLPPTYVGNSRSAPGGMLVDKAVTGSTGRAVSLDGGLFPLGLLVVREVLGSPDVVRGYIRIHCTRGTYKGVAALPMGDFS